MGNLHYFLIWLLKKIDVVCCKINMIMLSVYTGICHFCPANLFESAGQLEKKNCRKVEVLKTGNSHRLLTITTKRCRYCYCDLKERLKPLCIQCWVQCWSSLYSVIRESIWEKEIMIFLILESASIRIHALLNIRWKKPLFSQDSSPEYMLWCLASHKQHLKLFIWQRHLGHLSSVVSLMFIRTQLMLCCGFNTARVKSRSV